MKKRWFKPRDKKLPKGYDSWLEYRLHESALKDAEHHCSKEDRIVYSVPHTYEYDFIFECDHVAYVVEAKGRFRDSNEARKYIHIRDALFKWNLENKSCRKAELLLIFENSSTPMPFAKKRKDGTKQTHGEWATRNGFRWLCEKRGDLEGIVTKEDLVKKFGEENV